MGGALVCRNHARRISQVAGVNLVLCTAGPQEQELGDAAFANSIGAHHRFIPFCAAEPKRPSRWPFFFEAIAASQAHVDAVFLSMLEEERPDLLVTDYIPAAMFIRSAYRLHWLRRATITLNRETRFYRDLQRLRRVSPDSSYSPIATLRLRLFERWIYRNSDDFVALTADDLPRQRGSTRRHVIPPLFDAAPPRWRHRADGCILFIGNVHHYPNYEAIEWLATKFSAAWTRCGEPARLRVIGASQEDVPAEWRHPNIDFLGIGDKTVVQRELCSAKLFIAPITNAYGSKIKLLDCLSYGTPFVATLEGLSGLRFLSGVPIFRLEVPEEAARMTSALISEANTLTKLSETLVEQLAPQLRAQMTAWDRVVRGQASSDGM